MYIFQKLNLRYLPHGASFLFRQEELPLQSIWDQIPPPPSAPALAPPAEMKELAKMDKENGEKEVQGNQKKEEKQQQSTERGIATLIAVTVGSCKCFIHS